MQSYIVYVYGFYFFLKGGTRAKIFWFSFWRATHFNSFSFTRNQAHAGNVWLKNYSAIAFSIGVSLLASSQFLWPVTVVKMTGNSEFENDYRTTTMGVCFKFMTLCSLFPCVAGNFKD